MRPVKWQRNAIFEAVVAGGLDAIECSFEYSDAGARITHDPSGSSFVLGGDAAHYVSTSLVAEGPESQLDAFTWATVEERIERWARAVKEHADTPDLWAEVQREREMLTGARYVDVENTPFTPEERVRRSSAADPDERQRIVVGRAN